MVRAALTHENMGNDLLHLEVESKPLQKTVVAMRANANTPCSTN